MTEKLTKTRDYQAETNIWIQENPQMWAMFQNFARQMLVLKKKFGVQLIVERVRWEAKIKYDGDFKINNSYAPYIARRLMVEIPGLETLIQIRTAKDDRRFSSIEENLKEEGY